MVYAITYDLKRPGQQYYPLYEGIKGLGDWWHYLDSTWLVATHLTAGHIWQHLHPFLDPSDRMLIMSVGEDYHGWLPKDAWQWIEQQVVSSAIVPPPSLGSQTV